MKQYLLIPIEEISNELNRLNNKIVYSHEQEVYENSFIKYLEKLQSKGEIVEIEDKNIITELFHSTRPFGESIGDFIKSKSYKLIKTIKQ